MPFPVNCLNTAWEGRQLAVLNFGDAAWTTNFVWFALDCVMLSQYFFYARPLKVATLRDRLFWPSRLSILAVSIGTPVAMSVGFADPAGLTAAYFQNALMSILFCAMVLERDSLAGQSLYIALFKFMGTAVVVGYGEPSNAFLLWCYAVSMAFDLTYIALVLKVGRRDGHPVFRRF